VLITKSRSSENIVRSHERHFRKHLKEGENGPVYDPPKIPPTNDLFEVDFGEGNWKKFDYAIFRSWSAARRINRKIYSGRTYYTLSTRVSRPTELSHAKY